jgi:hypothetical protein
VRGDVLSRFIEDRVEKAAKKAAKKAGPFLTLPFLMNILRF